MSQLSFARSELSIGRCQEIRRKLHQISELSIVDVGEIVDLMCVISG